MLDTPAAFSATTSAKNQGRHGNRLDADLLETVTMLAKDEPLPRRYFDHRLSGEWTDHRDCHLRPDLILIYRKLDETGDIAFRVPMRYITPPDGRAL